LPAAIFCFSQSRKGAKFNFSCRIFSRSFFSQISQICADSVSVGVGVVKKDLADNVELPLAVMKNSQLLSKLYLS